VVTACPDKNPRKARYTPGVEVSVSYQSQEQMVLGLTQLLQVTMKLGWRLYGLHCDAVSACSFHLRLIVGPSASLYSSETNARAVTHQTTTSLTNYLQNYASSQPKGVDRLEYMLAVLEVAL